MVSHNLTIIIQLSLFKKCQQETNFFEISSDGSVVNEHVERGDCLIRTYD